MTTHRRTFLLAAGAAASASVFSLPARAQAYPARPITLYCPWPAGGNTDIVMRGFCESAARGLGQPILVENRPGAGGTLGPVALTQARPDGYTISQMPMGIFRIPHMQKVQFDPLRDFTYIACLTGYTFGLVVPGDSPIRSLKDLVAYAKANPEKLTYGSTGTGTTPHLVVEEFAMQAGIKLTHVPYKGNADGLQAVVGGHVMAHSDSTGWSPHVESGRLRLLVTYGSRRTKRWPNVPTLKDEGYNTVSDSPFGIGGPRGMDRQVIKRLHDAFKAALDDPKVIQVLDRYDQPVIYLDPEGYAKFARETYATEKATIERLGLAKPA